jgi:hypothetical protein
MPGSSRGPGPRQARPSGAAGDAPSAPLPRLFHLLPSGEVRLAHLEPLRACLTAALLSLDGLRFAAEDAVSPDPLVSTEALRIDISRFGADVRDQLDAALVEVDLLAGVSPEEVHRVA